MAVVTEISQQKKHTDRYSIFVGGEYSFSLTANQLLERKIHKGVELSLADIEKFKKISDDGKLLQKSYDKLARRMHSEKEIRDYLYSKKASPETINAIIDKLHDLKLLNDTAFASQWIENRRQFKHRSTRALSAELQQKGISREIINNLLHDSDDENKQALKRLAQKKHRQARYKDEQSLTKYLIGKGFAYAEVKDVVSSLQR